MKAWLRPTLVPRHSRPFDGAPPQLYRSFAVVSPTCHAVVTWPTLDIDHMPVVINVSAPPPSDPTT